MFFRDNLMSSNYSAYSWIEVGEFEDDISAAH